MVYKPFVGNVPPSPSCSVVFFSQLVLLFSDEIVFASHSLPSVRLFRPVFSAALMGSVSFLLSFCRVFRAEGPSLPCRKIAVSFTPTFGLFPAYFSVSHRYEVHHMCEVCRIKEPPHRFPEGPNLILVICHLSRL